LRRIYLLILILSILFSFTGSARASSAQDASQALVIAQVASENAYSALRSAQLAGANVSNLSSQFNQGLAYFEAAESADAAGNYNSTVIQANGATAIFNTIQMEAVQLKEESDSQNNLRSAILIISSIISVALITLGFRFVEQWRHRRWLKRLPEMRIVMKEEKREDT
jgi:hypothetical protein